ncbi:hypothetical protein [Pseudoalteromonas sp.]|uniref:hypothetical protein n=1 Tax=Pseudoalteromonas sp. TaxID=53249 RepID=UPI0035698C52
MKVVFNNVCDFLELDMPCVPRVGEFIYYDDNDFVVVAVEHCINDSGLSHVNVMLKAKLN